ncbi:hypothetical protein JXM67_12555 [candidate division WOR-3 bacterium]|nr:hypothetical protein [candidate division WOR-3 bacterium]
MLIIKCARCKRKLFKYQKIGSGRLLHLWPRRIIEDHSIHEGKEVKCQCGNIVGSDQGIWIKLKPQSFTYTGSYIRK